MVEVELPLILSLLTVSALTYFLVSLVPRVDEMSASYRKFGALTTLGIAYLVVIVLLVELVTAASETDPTGTVFGIAVGMFVLFGLTLLYDVFDDWIRLFANPEYNTWVELSMVLAVFVFLVVFFLLSP